MNGSAGPRIHGATGQRAPESGSVAGSGAQPLLDNNNNNNTNNTNHNNNNNMMMIILKTIMIIMMVLLMMTMMMIISQGLRPRTGHRALSRGPLTRRPVNSWTRGLVHPSTRRERKIKRREGTSKTKLGHRNSEVQFLGLKSAPRSTKRIK